MLTCLVVVVHDGAVGAEDDRLRLPGSEMLVAVLVGHHDLDALGLGHRLLLLGQSHLLARRRRRHQRQGVVEVRQVLAPQVEL